MLYSYLIAFIPIIVIYVAMPYLARRDNFFGVSAPEAFYSDPAAKKMRAQYSVSVTFVGLAFISAAYFTYGLMDIKTQAIVMTAGLFAMLLIMGLLYLGMRRKAKGIKAALKWEEAAEPVLVADTGFYSGKMAVSRLWFLAYAVIIIVTIAVGVYLYSSLPGLIPIRTDASGVVTYEAKSIKHIIFMPAIQIVVAGAFALGYYSIKKARPELSAKAVARTVAQNTKHRYAWSGYIVFSGLAMVALFFFVQLEMFSVLSGITMIATFVLAGLMIIGAIALALLLGQSGSRVKAADGEGAEKTLNRDDDKYWKMGMFYVNRDDPSLFVEKRFGIGFTLNFGRPLGWIVLAVIAIIIVGSIIISG